MLKNKLRSIPVVDSENCLGVVPYYAILTIFNHEFREDILKSGGIPHLVKEIEDIPPLASSSVSSVRISLSPQLMS